MPYSPAHFCEDIHDFVLLSAGSAMTAALKHTRIQKMNTLISSMNGEALTAINKQVGEIIKQYLREGKNFHLAILRTIYAVHTFRRLSKVSSSNVSYQKNLDYLANAERLAKVSFQAYSNNLSASILKRSNIIFARIKSRQIKTVSELLLRPVWTNLIADLLAFQIDFRERVSAYPFLQNHRRSVSMFEKSLGFLLSFSKLTDDARNLVTIESVQDHLRICSGLVKTLSQEHQGFPVIARYIELSFEDWCCLLKFKVNTSDESDFTGVKTDVQYIAQMCRLQVTPDNVVPEKFQTKLSIEPLNNAENFKQLKAMVAGFVDAAKMLYRINTSESRQNSGLLSKQHCKPPSEVSPVGSNVVSYQAGFFRQYLEQFSPHLLQDSVNPGSSASDTDGSIDDEYDFADAADANISVNIDANVSVAVGAEEFDFCDDDELEQSKALPACGFG